MAEDPEGIGHRSQIIRELTAHLAGGNPFVWTAGLAGHWPRERLAGAVADVQDTAPELHYTIALLWSFVESWVARQWQLKPDAKLAGKDYGP